MKKIVYLLIILFSISACKSVKFMTSNEKSLINSGSADTPFRVLQTDNQKDSLFLRKKSIDLDAKNIATNKDLQLLIDRLQMTLAVESGVESQLRRWVSGVTCSFSCVSTKKGCLCK